MQTKDLFSMNILNWAYSYGNLIGFIRVIFLKLGIDLGVPTLSLPQFIFLVMHFWNQKIRIITQDTGTYCEVAFSPELYSWGVCVYFQKVLLLYPLFLSWVG